MPINLILYYLIIILASVTSISTVLITLINLFRYLFSSSYASALSEKRIKIAFFIEYDILMVFTNYSTLLIRLIFIFNSSIRSVSSILFDFPSLININLFTISAFFIFILSIVLSFFRLFFINSNPVRGSMPPLSLRNLLTSSTRLLSYPLFFSCLDGSVVINLTNIAGMMIGRGIKIDSIFIIRTLISS